MAGSSETSNILASVATDQSNPLNGPNRPEPSSFHVPSPSVGRVSHLYQRFQAEGIPTNVVDLLIAATRTSTHKTYESSWNRWCRWCSRREIDLFSSSITQRPSFRSFVNSSKDRCFFFQRVSILTFLGSLNELSTNVLQNPGIPMPGMFVV